MIFFEPGPGRDFFSSRVRVGIFISSQVRVAFGVRCNPTHNMSKYPQNRPGKTGIITADTYSRLLARRGFVVNRRLDMQRSRQPMQLCVAHRMMSLPRLIPENVEKSKQLCAKCIFGVKNDNKLYKNIINVFKLVTRTEFAELSDLSST